MTAAQSAALAHLTNTAERCYCASVRGAQWAHEMEQGRWAADHEISTREKLRWIGKMKRFADQWLEPDYGLDMKDTPFPKMQIRHEIICAEPHLKEFCGPDPATGEIVVDTTQPAVVAFKLQFFSTLVNFVVHDGGCDRGGVVGDGAELFKYVEPPWEQPATIGFCAGENGCRQHTTAKNCQAGSQCSWIAGSWHEDESTGDIFYEPPSGWSFDPNEQNFFSTGLDRGMTRAMKEEMHAAWDAYCNAKVDKRWWISKKIRHAIGMDDPNDAVNSQNRCRFLWWRRNSTGTTTTFEKTDQQEAKTQVT